MVNKKWMVLAIFLVSLLAVSAVGAADNTTNDIVSAEETADEVVNVEDNPVILKENNDVGSFADLANEIVNGDNELNLTRNYTYNGDDSNYRSGILIDKSIIINGNGYTINGNDLARAFNITGSNVILNDIRFVNCSTEGIYINRGGAVYWSGDKGILSGCNFVNCYSFGDYGGAVYWKGLEGSLSDCSFVNCSVDGYGGGAICWFSDDGNLSGCNFMNCSAGNDGGAIYWSGTYDDLSDCSFVNCSAGNDGGAIYCACYNVNVIDSTFKNCHAINTGGGIYFKGSNCNLVGSIFENNTAQNCSDWYSEKPINVINRGTFVELAYKISKTNNVLNLNRNYTYCDDDASYKYGIKIDKNIVINGNGFTINGNNQARIFNIAASDVVLNNIKFVNCINIYSSCYGSAVYWDGANGVLANCSFVNSSSNYGSSSYGGAVYWNGANGVLANCNFVNSSSNSASGSSYSYGGAVYWAGDNGTAYECSFINSSSFSDSINTKSAYSCSCGGAVYWQGTNGNLSNCIFINSSSKSITRRNGSYPTSEYDYDSRSYGGVVYWNGANGVLANCRFVNSSSYSSISVSGAVDYYNSSNGGAVYWNGINGILSYGSFVNSFVGGAGGAICWRGNYGILSNCNFVKSNGCAVCWDWHSDNGVLANCSFVNSSSWNGGGVSWGGNNGSVSNCSFVNSVAQNFGGAVYWYGSYGRLSDCSFVNSSAQNGAGAVSWSGNNGTLQNCCFLNSNISPNNHGSAIYWSGYNSTIINYTVDNKIGQVYIIHKLKNPPFKTEISGNISNMVIDKDLSVNISIDNGADIELSVYIDGNYIQKIHESINMLNVLNLSAGKHNITIITDEDQNFEPAEYNDMFRAFTIYPIEANDTKIIYGSDKRFQAKFYDEYGNTLPNKYISFIVNGTTKISKTNNEGIATLDLDLDVGEYTITSRNGFVDESKDNTLLIFNTIQAENMILEYDSGVKFTATFLDEDAKPLFNTDIIFIVDGIEQVATTDANGKAILNNNLSIGTHEIVSVNTVTDKNLTNYVVVVSDIDSILSIDIQDINYTQNAILNVNIGSSYLNATVEIKITGDNGFEQVFTQNASESITKELIGLNEGTYNVYVKYTYSDDLFVIEKNKTFTVNKFNKINTTLISSDVIAYYKSDKLLVATLKDDDDNAIIEATVKIVLNGVTNNLTTDSNGQVSLSLNDMKPGNYMANITFDGNYAYKESNTTANVIINKAYTIISSPDVSVAYKDPNGELVATIINEHGKPLVVNLNINFNGEDYTVKTDSNGQATIPIGTLSPGTYTATISYKGSSNYKASTATAKVKVTKAATIITAPDVTVAYKDPNGELVATIISEHGKPLVVNLNINFNGKDYTVKTDSNGQATIAIGTLTPGKYDATISYKGSGNYKASTATSKVTVTKSDTIISAHDVSLAYKDPNAELVATIINEHGKPLVVTLSVDLNGKTYTAKTDSNGQASIAIGTLTPGKYTATVSYKGSSNYKASSTTAKVTVTKADTVISAPNINVAYKDPNAELVATIINEHGKPLVVTLNVDLNGKTYTAKTDSNGQAIIAIGTLSPGKYTATISYKGSSNYKASTATAKVTVTKAATIISAPNVKIAYKDPSGELVATITNEHGKPLVVNLNVNINGKDYTVKTDSNGQASIAVDTLTPGTYTATISYKGSGNYKASSTTAKVTVTKAATIISAPDVSVAYMDPNGKLVSTITNEHGKPLVVNLNVDLNGKTYTAKTDSNGQVIVSTADLNPGTYTATISYKGSGNYKASSTTANITVKP